MKNSGYKYQIKKELEKRNIEIIELGGNEDWWDDEHWKLRHKYIPNTEFFICFMVDPQFEGNRKKGQGIYEIMTSTKFPKSWTDNDNSLGSLYLAKRKFNIKLSELMSSIDEFVKNCT